MVSKGVVARKWKKITRKKKQFGARGNAFMNKEILDTCSNKESRKSPVTGKAAMKKGARRRESSLSIPSPQQKVDGKCSKMA